MFRVATRAAGRSIVRSVAAGRPGREIASEARRAEPREAGARDVVMGRAGFGQRRGAGKTVQRREGRLQVIVL